METCKDIPRGGGVGGVATGHIGNKGGTSKENIIGRGKDDSGSASGRGRLGFWIWYEFQEWKNGG